MQSHRLASGWWPNRMRAGKETQPMCFHVGGQTIWAFFPELQKSKSPCAPSSWYKFSMGTGCILAAAGSHPLQMLLKLVQWWLLIHPVIHCCVGSTCVQMPSDSTPKYHSSPCTCFLMNADKMFLSGMRCRGASPLWVQPPGPPYAPVRVQGAAPSVNWWWSTAGRNVLLRMQKEEPWWLLQLEKCQDMVNSLWDTAINGCRNHKLDQATRTKSTGKTSAFFQLSILKEKEKATQTYSGPAFEVMGLFFFIYIYTYLWLCTVKFIEDEQFFFRGSNHSSRQQKMAKWDKDNTLWYLFIVEQVFQVDVHVNFFHYGFLSLYYLA